MRTWILPIFTGFTLLVACDGSSTSTNTSSNTGGGGGSGGETSSTTSEGGGGSGGGTTSSAGGSGGGSGGSGGSTMMPSDPCETASGTPAFFANEVQPIFGERCGNAMACHLAPNPSEGLSLKPGEAYANLVNVDANQTCNGQKRVEPGSAVGSYIVNKITATDVCPTTKKMPPSTTLPDADKQKIIDWICQGAENN